ncbi:MAG: thioesterase family protein [Bacteroidales bacterium]
MMKDTIVSGQELELTDTVRETDTARTYGSGLLDVYSTPAMVAFMEKTSMELVQPQLEKGHGTVGMSLDIKHKKAVPVGGKIKCISRLATRDGNRLSFEVRVYHGADIIGEGKHMRYIIDEKRFLAGIK